MNGKGIPVIERFDLNWIPEPYSGCWLWIGSTDGHGYGKIWAGTRTVSAHRLSWMLSRHSEIPSGMCICHTCDTPSCVNPDHLFVGSRQDNSSDMAKKGRARNGRFVV